MIKTKCDTSIYDSRTVTIVFTLWSSSKKTLSLDISALGTEGFIKNLSLQNAVIAFFLFILVILIVLTIIL